VPLQLGERTAVLHGTVTVDEAEPLASWLRGTVAARIDLHDCDHLHTSALQALLAAGVQVTAAPTDAFLRAWVLPLLHSAPHAVPDGAETSAPTERIPLDDTDPVQGNVRTTEGVAP
jgi:hypothetical protein